MKETEEEKYNALRSLIAQKNCPTIVYVSRTRRTIQLAEKLTSDGFPAKPFNGKMDSNEKITNQEAFINNQVKMQLNITIRFIHIHINLHYQNMMHMVTLI